MICLSDFWFYNSKSPGHFTRGYGRIGYTRRDYAT